MEDSTSYENDKKEETKNEIIEKNNFQLNEEKMNLLINNNQENILNIFSILNKVFSEKDNSSLKSENEYYLNLLLMSSKLTKLNKLICLLLLLYLNQYNRSNDTYTHSLLSKIKKISKTLEKPLFVEKFLHLKDSNFLENKNYLFFAKDYLTDIKGKLINPSSDRNLLADIILNDVNRSIQSYLDSYKKIFTNKEIMDNNRLDKLKKTMDLINDENNRINYPCFLINKNWVFKAKSFVNSFINILKENLENVFIENAFNIEMVYDYITVKLDNQIERSTLGVIFPGPINNYELMDLNDYWFDPEKTEENLIIKNNVELNKDYFLMNEDDWFFLKNIFDATNDIKRIKKDERFFKIKMIILAPTLCLKENNYLLKLKKIQINIDSNIKEFKNKIIRCLNHATKKSINSKVNEEKDIVFYLINKKNKDIILEIIPSYVNLNKIYQSIYVQQMTFQNEELIKDTFNYIDNKKYILIAEIIDKNTPRFIEPLISTIENSNLYNCVSCNYQFNLNQKYNCNLCNESLFCSRECAEANENHKKLHELLNQLYCKKFELNTFFIEKEKQAKKDIQRRIVGLEKDKKYSSINSIIQCLSSNNYLVSYFLEDFHKNDLSISNYFQSNGKYLSFQYCELIKEMWTGDKKSNKIDDIHTDFVTCLEKKASEKIPNFNLGSTKEIFKFLLNSFHVELKRPIDIDYINDNNINTEENSIITDLYQGIYESIISCPKCGNVSHMNRRNFTILELPIPKRNQIILVIKYFNDFKCNYFKFLMDENSTIKDLKDKAIKNVSDKIKHLISVMSLSNSIDVTPFDTDENEKIITYQTIYNCIELIQFDKNKIIIKAYETRINEDKTNETNDTNNNNNNNDNNSNIINDSNLIKRNDLNVQLNRIHRENELELVFFERSIIDKECRTIYVYPFLYNEKENIKKNRDRLFNIYPIAITAKLDLILENFEYSVNVKLRDLLIDHFREESEKRDINYIELVIPHYFCDSPYYSQANCPFCKDKRRNNLFCPLFSFIDKEKTVADLPSIFDYANQPFFLLAKCKYYDPKKKIYSNMSSFQVEKTYKKQDDNKIDIYDCFELLSKNEDTNKSDWMCNLCKSKLIPNIQSLIYKPPLFLIIQIDRVSLKIGTFRNSFIIDDIFIYYPINNLDLKDYVEGSEQLNTKYNLYGVIYRESSSFRNDICYTVCKINDKWMAIKDSKVAPINTNIVNKNAHFLFYKRQDLQD